MLDSRQTRLLKMFGVYMSEFHIRVLAYYTLATGEVTELVAPELRRKAGAGVADDDDAMDGLEEADADE